MTDAVSAVAAQPGQAVTQATIPSGKSWGQFLVDLLNAIPFEAVMSVGVATVVLLLAQALSWSLTKKQPLENRRFWRITFRNIAAVVILMSIAAIWRDQLHTLIMALGAATAGMLLVFREAFLSLLAFWIHLLRRPYSLGDFIEVDGVSGQVMDITWQHTILAETGPGMLSYSGRLVQIPNNRMLLAPLFVDNMTGEFGAHIMEVHLPGGADILKAEGLLLLAAEKNCSPFYEEARRHMLQLRQAHAIDTPSIEPKSRILLGEEGAATLVLRIVVPFREKLRVEQKILHDFFASTDLEAWPRTP